MSEYTQIASNSQEDKRGHGLFAETGKPAESYAHDAQSAGKRSGSDRNAFRRLWDLGYRSLIPIVPPGAPVSERSSIARRLAVGDDARGKSPGRKNAEGLWSSFDWIKHETTEADLERWHAMGAGAGIRTGNGLVLIDADTLNDDHASIIAKEIQRAFGQLPVRYGNAPKAGYLIRTDEDFRYSRIEFGSRDAKGRLKDRVEILAGRRQFVAHGIHPKTGKPYLWANGIVPRDQLPYAPGHALLALLDRLAEILPAATRPKQSNSRSAIDQSALIGDWELVQEAVAATPNTSAVFPEREDYVNYAYAIRAAAGPDHLDDAKALFLEWCARWQDGDNKPEIAAADFDRCTGDENGYRIGANFLYEKAHEHSGGQFNIGKVWFDPTPIPTPLFPAEETSASEGTRISASQYLLTGPATIPTRQWLYGRHYIRSFLSVTSASSGVGKSSLVLIEALAMVTGKPLLGEEPRGQFRVWLWNGEDPRDELSRRVEAAASHYGLTSEDLGGRLFVDSGREMEICLASRTRTGAVLAEPVARNVEDVLLEKKIDVLILDPFVSTHRVKENDNDEIELVAKRWAKIADRCNCSIELVHHVRKLNGDEATVESTRGGGALIAAARSKRVLARMPKNEAQKIGLTEIRSRLFRVADEVNNLALASDKTSWFHLRSVPLGNGPGKDLDALLGGDQVGVVESYEVVPTLDLAMGNDEKSERRETALRLIREGEWRRDVRSGDAWVGHPIAQAFELDLDDPEDKGRVRQFVSQWIKSGVLREESRKDNKSRHKTFVVAPDSGTPAGDEKTEFGCPGSESPMLGGSESRV